MNEIKKIDYLLKTLFKLNRSDNKQIYSFYKQATKHTQLEPLLVIKTLREKPLAIIDLEHLFELQEDTDH